MSLGQGSGAAPMGLRNIITLADNAYKRLWHAINMESAISARIFLLAAITYVDDTAISCTGPNSMAYQMTPLFQISKKPPMTGEC
jgi:hypothetical protein